MQSLDPRGHFFLWQRLLRRPVSESCKLPHGNRRPWVRAGGRSTEVEGMALGGGCHGESGAHVGNSGIDGCLESGVVPPGIVVKRHQVPGTHQSGEGERMVYRAVAPADMPGVL